MFSNTKNTTQRGSVGEARAIYEYVKAGWIVSKPINDKAKYDLIVDTGVNLLRVQVKTTTKRTKSKQGYEVKLVSTYSNRNATVRKYLDANDYDLLFVLTENGDAWSIPITALSEIKQGIVVGNTKYAEYRI